MRSGGKKAKKGSQREKRKPVQKKEASAKKAWTWEGECTVELFDVFQS